MALTVWQEVYIALHRAFRTLIPQPHDRTPWAWSNAHWALWPFIPLVFMAYLVRRRDTLVMRLLLLPSVICLSIYSSHAHYWPQPWLQSYNWAQSLACVQLIAKALDFAFTPMGRFKVGETKLPPIGGETDAPEPSSPVTKHQESHRSFLPPALSDAFEVICASRGYGWDFGEGVHKPQEYRPLERRAFMKATWKIFFKNFLFLDFLESCVKVHPERYAVSTILHITTGTAFIVGFEMAYALATLIGVGLLDHSPLLWPPFLDHPFSSDSLTIFWAKRWHQFLRRLFIVFGGNPGFWLGSWISEEAAKVFMLLGVFTASGLFHELTTYTMGRGFDKDITMFFVWQAFAVLGERVWYKVTGRKVQGWIGLIWVYFWIMILGQPCINAWFNRGLAGSVHIPIAISPTRRLLWPTLRRLHPFFEFLP